VEADRRSCGAGSTGRSFDPKPTTQFTFLEAGSLVVGIQHGQLLGNRRCDLILGTMTHQTLSLQLDRQQGRGMAIRQRNELRRVDIALGQDGG